MFHTNLAKNLILNTNFANERKLQWCHGDSLFSRGITHFIIIIKESQSQGQQCRNCQNYSLQNGMIEMDVHLLSKPKKHVTLKKIKTYIRSQQQGENVTVSAVMQRVASFHRSRKLPFACLNKKSSSFLPHKPIVQCQLILNGHTSRYANIEMI